MTRRTTRSPTLTALLQMWDGCEPAADWPYFNLVHAGFASDNQLTIAGQNAAYRIFGPRHVADGRLVVPPNKLNGVAA